MVAESGVEQVRQPVSRRRSSTKEITNLPVQTKPERRPSTQDPNDVKGQNSPSTSSTMKKAKNINHETATLTPKAKNYLKRNAKSNKQETTTATPKNIIGSKKKSTSVERLSKPERRAPTPTNGNKKNDTRDSPASSRAKRKDNIQREKGTSSNARNKHNEKAKGNDDKNKASFNISKSTKNQANLKTWKTKVSTKIHRKAVDQPEDSDENIDFSVIEKKIFEGVRNNENVGKKGVKRLIGARTPGKGTKNDKTTRPTPKPHPSRLKESRNNGSTPKGSKDKVILNKKTDTSRSKGNQTNSGSTSKKSISTGKEKKSSSKEIRRNQNKGEKSRDTSKESKKRERSKDTRKKSDQTASDSDASDWEEVEEEEIDEAKELLEDCGFSQLKEEEGVRIELDAPDLLWGMKKRKRRTEEEMIEDYLRKNVNRSIKVVYENMHKAHLLCLLAHGRFLNQTLNSEVLLGAALSIVTDKNAYPPKRLDLGYLQKFVAWFGRKITRVSKELPEDYWSQEITKVLTGRFETKTAYKNRELVFMFVVLCRTLGINIRLVIAFQPVSWKPGTEVLLKKGKKVDEEGGNSKEDEKKSEIPQASTSKTTFIKDKQGRTMLSSESDVETPSKKTSKKKAMDKNIKRKSLSEDDDSNFELSPSKFRKGPKSTSSQKKVGAKRKSTEGKEGGKKKKGDPLVEWAEVYVEEEEKWVCVDILRGKIHCVAEIETQMPSGSAYITAFNVNLSVKDVSRRYIRSWLSSEKKLRCDSEWWGESIRAFRGIQSRIDKEEEKELNQNLRQQPLPTSIGEYKNHPLYALQRHLLKFEAIYPPDESPVGFNRGEPVYPRESVKNLHSRDTWMKEAKSVRVGEEPYKIVKARPKWDRNTNQVIKDRPLEVFGEWQVEDYEPPVAKDGKVPRNDYGNVELFKPTMLPRGCVHIPINGLNKLARILDIDCAPAMVGFDFHSGWTHPVYDGYVVCEEFKDILLDAWNEELAEQARRAEEKRQKRIYDNWRRLIKGMVVRARVREDYKNLSDEEEEEKKTEEETEDTKTESKQATRKIKQADIDALRLEHNNSEEKTNEANSKTNEPDIKTSELNKNTDEAGPSKPRPLITHTIKNLKIDLSSNVVEMARKSRQKTMRTKNTVKKPPAKKKQKESAKKDGKESLKKVEAGNLSDDSSETDEEVKKEKIRAILNWGTEAVTANPELSDDSDAENTSQSSSSSFQPQLSNPFFASIISPALEKAKKVRKKRRTRTPTEPAEGESESEQSEASSSRSTTPEPDVGEPDNAGPRRLSSRRMPKKKSVTYAESASDISIDSSGCEDRSYNPGKEKSVTYVESASDIFIDSGDFE